MALGITTEENEIHSTIVRASSVLKVLIASLLVAGGWPTPVMAQFANTVDLAADTADVVIDGASAGDLSGYSMAAGDINGDGFDDLVIAANNAAPLPGRAGEYDIIWGPLQSGAIDLALPSSSVSRIFGEPGTILFSEVTTGDFDGDGYDDILIGQPSFDGRAYVIRGSATFPDTVDLVTGHELASTIHGALFESGQLGQGVCACDMDGDGYDEIIVSAPTMSVPEAYVVQGSDSIPETLYMDGPFAGLTRIIHNRAGYELGRGLACADIDGDGFNDLAIGAPGSEFGDVGSVSIIYGDAVLPDTILIAGGGVIQKHFVAEKPNDGFGERLGFGHLDGDSQLDLVISGYNATLPGCPICGEIFVFYDVDGLPDSLVANTLSYPISRLIGEAPQRVYGHQMRIADLSADGTDDIVAGVLNPPDDKVVVVYGEVLTDSVFPVTDTTNTTHILPEVADEGLGKGMATGDFNHDGITDLALGAFWHDVTGRENSGRSYVLFGPPTVTAVSSPTIPVSFLESRPNPFSVTTRFEYELDVAAPIAIEIFNVVGQRVAAIYRPTHGPGRFEVQWDGRGESGSRLPSGVYFYRLEVQGRKFTKKVTILR